MKNFVSFTRIEWNAVAASFKFFYLAKILSLTYLIHFSPKKKKMLRAFEFEVNEETKGFSVIGVNTCCTTNILFYHAGILQ